MTAQQTFNEMLDSLTGYEEQAIENQFGADIYALLNNATKASRALVFTSLNREEGSKPAEVRKRVMGMTIREINAFWQDDADEPMPDEPVTASGKDDSLDG